MLFYYNLFILTIVNFILVYEKRTDRSQDLILLQVRSVTFHVNDFVQVVLTSRGQFFICETVY